MPIVLEGIYENLPNCIVLIIYEKMEGKVRRDRRGFKWYCPGRILPTSKIAIILIFPVLLFVSLIWAATGEGHPERILKRGASGETVLKVQEILSTLGFFTARPDGIYGQETEIAVIQFQCANGLTPDGVVGPETWGILHKAARGEAVNRALPAGARRAEEAVSIALAYLGTPYVWSGSGPSGFDCSGFVAYIYGKVGIELPRMADEQFAAGIPIAAGNLQPGDLVFFSTYEPGPSHVGIYIGNAMFVHASSGAGKVTITPMAKPYYQARYLGARRIIK